MVKIKICGITNYRDAVDAIDCGADAVGFVLAKSPRQVTAAQARNIIGKLPPFVIKAGVFVNAPLKEVLSMINYCGFNLVQLHGDEPREYCRRLYPFALKVFRGNDDSTIKLIKQYGARNFMLDSGYGGTGKLVDIKIAKQASRLGNMLLAGGLTPENVAEVVRIVKPYGVDVSSGVERTRKGVAGKTTSPMGVVTTGKDKRKMRAFINAVRETNI